MVEAFQQLFGYALLDYDNAYGIHNVALYLSRYGALIEWELPNIP